MSVVAKPEELKDIRLDRVDPEVCSLKAVAAAKLAELALAQPLIHFNKDDRRFVAGNDVLETVGDTNLATMDWQDLEYLIRELLGKVFASSRADVKVTPASRDRGADAVVFDDDPLRGG